MDGVEAFPHLFITGQHRGGIAALSPRRRLSQLTYFAHQREHENVFFTSL